MANKLKMCLDSWGLCANRLFLLFAVVCCLNMAVSCAPLPSAPPILPSETVEEGIDSVSEGDKGTAFQPVQWSDLVGWGEDDLRDSLVAFRASCASLKYRSDWQAVCAVAENVGANKRAARAFFQHHFIPWRVVNEQGGRNGLITGYYVPDLDGSRQRSDEYCYPLYGRPDDLLVVDLSAIYPEIGHYRLRGRLEGNRVVPYWSRDEIDGLKQPLVGSELFWVRDPVELFFLQIQGSGRITLDDGSQVMVNYADQNGHPFRSIGTLLVKSGEMTRHQMSKENLVEWGQKNPRRVQQLLNENPRYVFFRSLKNNITMPPGALGVPLTAERSIAVDPRTIPLGAPVYLSTTRPNSVQPLRRLMVAQDAGGAIKGRVRADLFWGVGDEAGSNAGRMKQQGQMWLLLPKGMLPAEH